MTLQNGNQYGPPLAGVGAAAVDFQVGTGRMPMARPGVQAPKKEVVYSEEEISALAAFVASLGPGPAIPEAEAYDPEAIPEDEREEAVVRGGEFFRTNCTACHNFAASGGALPDGKYAPTLLGVEPVHIYEAMLTGPQQMPVFSDQVLTPEDKREVIAYLKSIEEQPKYGGSTMGSFGPVSEGLFAWLIGIGACVGFAVWIASNSTRCQEGSPVVSDHPTDVATREDQEPIPDPGLHDTSRGPPTSTRRPPGAPSDRSRRCSACPRSWRCCSSSPTSPSRSARTPT